MKKVFTTMLVCMFTCLCAMAQLNIWYNGAVVYQRDYTKIDSITFVIQSVTPPEEVNVSLPGKVERLLGTPDDELHALMISKGYNLVSESANEVGELTLLFVNDNEDSITCGFVQSNLLTDVTAIMHFANSSSPFETYKAWSDTTYHLTAWQRWEAEMKELPQSYSQYFSGRTLFASILNNMSSAAYSAEYYTIEYRGNDASLTFQQGALISRITYKRSFHKLPVPPTSISLPDTAILVIGETNEIPYQIQPHGALTDYIDFTVEDTSIAKVEGTRIKGLKYGTTILHADYANIHKTAVIQCICPIENDGMYVIGPATGVENMYAMNNNNALMANGTNEATKEAREGMYEKYIALEAGKNFEFILYERGQEKHYSANLQVEELVCDGPNHQGWRGFLLENNNTPMQVNTTGLYHIVLDLNKDGLLDAAGGAQVIIAPVSWGISGGMNGWSMTVGQKADSAYTWTWEGVEIPANTEFKFKDEHGWKIFLDGETQQVSTETNLGANLVPGGNSIKVTSSGIYTITLTWSLAGGGIANSYMYEMTKTADLVLDPATFVVGISGSMNYWADPDGIYLAKFDANSSQIDASKVGTYVYKMEGVSFPAESEFKFRFNGNWLGVGAVEVSGVTPTGDDNYKGVEGAYDIVITVAWDGNQATSMKADFTEGTPQLVDITISAIVPAEWTHCYLWAWNSYGSFFQAWPGQELQINNGSVSYSFVNVAAPLNVIFSNGDGAQTFDILDVHDGQLIDIATKLK